MQGGELLGQVLRTSSQPCIGALLVLVEIHMQGGEVLGQALRRQVL